MTEHSTIQAIVSSLREAISQEAGAAGLKHEPTPSEYFAAIIAVFQSAQVDHAPQFVQVLAAVAPKCHKTLIQSQFSTVCDIIFNIIRAYSDDETVLRPSVEVLGVCCCAVEASDGFWAKSESIRIINALLTFIDDARPQLRKESVRHLKNILVLHKTRNCKSVRSYVSEFCVEVLKTGTRANYKRPRFVLLFLENVMSSFTDSDVLKIFTPALRLINCEQPALTLSVLRTIDCLFQAPNFSLGAEGFLSCFKTLLSQQEKTSDMESLTIFYSSLSSGLLYFQKSHSSSLTPTLLSSVISCYVNGCDSDFIEIHCAIANSLKRIMAIFFKPAVVHSELTIAFRRCFSIEFEQLFNPAFQSSWVYIMDAVKSFFEQIGLSVSGTVKTDANYNSIVFPLVKSLTATISAVSTGVLQVSPGSDTALEGALVGAVSSLGGPTALLNVLCEDPSASSPPNTVDLLSVFSKNRSWIFRFFYKHLKFISCSMDDFAMNILPCIDYCSRRKSSANTAIISDLWRLFPEFCSSYDSKDISIGFPKIISAISAMLSGFSSLYTSARASKDLTKQAEVEEIRDAVSSILGGLANTARVVSIKSTVIAVGAIAARNASDATVISGYAQTILPALISFLEAVDLHDKLFQTCIQSVEMWSTIAPPQLLSSVSKKLLQLLLTSSAGPSSNSEAGAPRASNEGVSAAKWMSIILTLIPRLSGPIVQLLYRTVKPLLSVNESVTIQKRSYLVLRALLANRSNDLLQVDSQSHILTMLGESFLLCHVSARNMRLECMEIIIRSMDSSSESCGIILGEVLISLKDSNKKCRMTALSLLNSLVQRVAPDDMFVYLCSAIAGETPSMRSAAINAMLILLMEYRKTDVLLVQKITALLPTLCLLLGENNVEQSRSILSLFKAYISSAPIEILMTILPDLIHSTLTGSPEMKSKFVNKARKIIRKSIDRLGMDVIRPLVPDSDLGLLTYLEKQERRKDRKKTSGKSRNDSVVDDKDDDAYSNSDDSVISEFVGTEIAGDIPRGAQSERSLDELTVAVANKYNQQDTDSTEDYRLSRRMRATFSSMKDMGRNSFVPMSLDDLMEDQESNTKDSLGNKMKAGQKRNRGDSQDNDMEVVKAHAETGDKFAVRIDESGMLIVEEATFQEEQDEGPAIETDVKETRATDAFGNDEGSKKMKKAPTKTPGEEYRAKNAGGDVWKRGMLQPHAYVPLDGRLLAKSNTQNAVVHFGALVKSGKGSKKQLVSQKNRKTLSRNKRNAMKRHEHNK